MINTVITVKHFIPKGKTGKKRNGIFIKEVIGIEDSYHIKRSFQREIIIQAASV